MIHPCARPRSASRGFTLVELMVTVAIVGILSVAAYAGYHKFVVSSRLTEAENILAGLKMREQGYLAEKGKYLNLSIGLAANGNNSGYLYPHCTAGATPGAFSVAWGGACPASCCAHDFSTLHIESSAPTFYGFSSVADTSSMPTVNINGAAVTWPTNPLNSWFVATAVGDSDGNKVYSTVMISSFDNEVRIDNDGE
ncbi:MAG TPA: prepilin-type N-terminal cleavage/methylation domain-containing protein [Polyangiaceae bacterium]